jgi:hypothetical protein
MAAASRDFLISGGGFRLLYIVSILVLFTGLQRNAILPTASLHIISLHIFQPRVSRRDLAPLVQRMHADGRISPQPPFRGRCSPPAPIFHALRRYHTDTTIHFSHFARHRHAMRRLFAAFAISSRTAPVRHFASFRQVRLIFRHATPLQPICHHFTLS